MIIIINGCVGIGKTTTGSALNDLLPNSLFIDGDSFFQHSNLNHTSNDWYKNWLDVICMNINLHFTKWNTKNFVISYVFENSQSILNLVNAINTQTEYKNASIYFFLLTANINIIHERIKKRSICYSNDYNDQNNGLKWELNRSKELNNILLNCHSKQLNSVGQLINTSNLNIKQTANKIKCIVINYENNIKNWTNILPKYLINNDNDNKDNQINDKNSLCLEPMDFLNEFKDIIVNRKKCATTRWFKDEEIKLNNMKEGVYMIGTIDDGKTPFAILHINKIQKYALKEIDDDIAKIENMNNGIELIELLKKIYPTICDDDQVEVVFFTCCHFIGP